MTHTSSVQTGSAITDATNGWFVGDFIDEKLGLRHSSDVELKWGVHPKGQERKEWVTGESRTTISILISGTFEIIFRGQSVTLEKPGDFVIWGKGDDHA